MAVQVRKLLISIRRCHRIAVVIKQLTGEGVKKALETLKGFDTGGLVPPITYTATDHRPTTKTTIYVIKGGKLTVEAGHQGRADLAVSADSRAWLDFLRKDRSLAWLLMTRQLKLKGPPRLMRAFGRCFPS